ncbi:MAG TPA: GntR family transcriptional regulator [Solirubrobacteraceae bacterium]
MVNRRQGTAPVALPWEIAVDREAEVPLGVQLAWALRSRIGEGRLQPGRRLPGLRELAETIGVNLNTVRAVYQRLEQEGLLETQQGSGTYVARTAMGASPAGEIAAGAARAAIEQGVSPREVAAALYVSEPAAQPPRGPDAGRRNAIRAEIASLELVLGALEAAHPGVAPPPSGRRGGGPHLLSAEELEAQRTKLTHRLASVQIAIDERDAEPSATPARRPSATPARRPSANRKQSEARASAMPAKEQTTRKARAPRQSPKRPAPAGT